MNKYDASGVAAVAERRTIEH